MYEITATVVDIYPSGIKHPKFRPGAEIASLAVPLLILWACKVANTKSSGNYIFSKSTKYDLDWTSTKLVVIMTPSDESTPYLFLESRDLHTQFKPRNHYNCKEIEKTFRHIYLVQYCLMTLKQGICHYCAESELVADCKWAIFRN